MNLLITESQISRAIRYAINEMIDEERTENQDGTVEVDNFQTVSEFMKFEKPGDTIYFVKIIKRDKDNPGQKSQFDACQYLKEFYFKSNQEFMDAENEIKTLCKSLNARAYIYMNPRSKAVIDKYTKIEMQKIQRNAYTRAKYGGHEMALAAGRSLDLPERPICFVDVDSDDQKDINAAMKIIQDAGIKPIFAYRSLNNGIHIILPNKEDAKKLDFTPITGDLSGLGRRAKMNAKVGVEIDKAVLLYACLKPQGYEKQQARFQNFVQQKNDGTQQQNVRPSYQSRSHDHGGRYNRNKKR